MIRTLSLVSVLALLPATACGQQPTEDALNAKAAEAEMAMEAKAETPQVGLPNGSEAPAVSLVDTAGVTQTLETLAGPKGTVIAFVRSAVRRGLGRNQGVQPAEHGREAGLSL